MLEKGERQVNRGLPPEDVAKATLIGMEKNEKEIMIGMAQNIRSGAKDNFEQIFSE